MRLPKRPLVIAVAALLLVLGTLIAGANSDAYSPSSSAPPIEQEPKEFKDFPSLASGPAPKGVKDAIDRFNGKIAFTGFMRRALGKKLGSPTFVAAAGVAKDATGKAKPEDLTADQVVQAVVETAHELSGMVSPKNLPLEAVKQNALAATILNKVGAARGVQSSAPLKNVLTGQILSSDLQSFDWRDKGWVAMQSGIVSRAKDQSLGGTSSCGCCWAFATIGTFEGADALLNRRLIDASEQNLLDCYATKFGTAVAPFDCRGGWWAFDEIINPGVADEGIYPYLGAQQPSCQDGVATPFQAVAWKYVLDQGDIPSTNDQIKAIKDALCQYGPIATSVYASTAEFGGSDGKLPIKSFPSGQMQVNSDGQQAYTDHAIVIVGWDNTKNAWAIKNSWGETWGSLGFGYVDYFANNIGYGSAYVTPVKTPAANAGVGAPLSAARHSVPTIPKQEQRKKNP